MRPYFNYYALISTSVHLYQLVCTYINYIKKNEIYKYFCSQKINYSNKKYEKNYLHNVLHVTS